MLGILKIALGVDGRVVEVGLGLALRGGECGFDLRRCVRDLEALAAAAAGRFERQGQPVLLRRDARRGDVGDRFGAAGHDRDARRDHRLARADLVAHRVDGVGMRPDPGHAGGDDGAREARVLGKKTVARMQRLGAALPRDLDQPVGVQIALRRRRRA